MTKSQVNLKTLDYSTKVSDDELEKQIEDILSKKHNKANDWNNHLIGSLAWYGRTKLFKKYMNYKDVDITYSGNEPLMNAFEERHPEIVEILMSDERVRNSLSKTQRETSFIKKALKKYSETKIGKFKDFLDI